jgi:hypothetical protein
MPASFLTTRDVEHLEGLAMKRGTITSTPSRCHLRTLKSTRVYLLSRIAVATRPKTSTTGGDEGSGSGTWRGVAIAYAIVAARAKIKRGKIKEGWK